MRSHSNDDIWQVRLRVGEQEVPEQREPWRFARRIPPALRARPKDLGHRGLPSVPIVNQPPRLRRRKTTTAWALALRSLFGCHGFVKLSRPRTNRTSEARRMTTSCHHFVEVSTGTRTTTTSAPSRTLAAAFRTHASTPSEYGGLHHTRPRHGRVSEYREMYGRTRAVRDVAAASSVNRNSRFNR